MSPERGAAPTTPLGGTPRRHRRASRVGLRRRRAEAPTTTPAVVGAATEPEPSVASSVRRPSVVPDIVIALVLLGWALVVRWNFPKDGLFYDDAWQALGPARASLRQLLAVSEGQPGFGLLLMAWSRVFGAGSTSMVTPALIGGALGPPVIFLGLRWFRYSRAIAALTGALLVIVAMHINFSTHVKSYTIDLLIVIVVAIVVTVLARQTWDVRTAIAWCTGATIVASFSAVTPLIAIAAGIVVVVHPRGDLRVRLAAVAAQVVVLVAYVSLILTTFDVDEVNRYWKLDGAYIGFTPNPVSLGHEVFEHLVRVATVFTNGRRDLAIAVLLIALIGLAGAAWRGPRTVPARFFGLVLLGGLGGAVIERVPLGSGSEWGGRIVVWLAPVFAFGVAAALDFVRRAMGRHTWSRTAVDSAIAIAACLVLVSTFGDHRVNLYPGARQATLAVMARLRPDDVVLTTRPTTYSFALAAGIPVSVRATPKLEVGFRPVFSDPRIVPLEWTLPERRLRRSLRHAESVYVIHAHVGDSPHITSYLKAIGRFIEGSGFRLSGYATVGTAVVSVWARKPGTGAAGAGPP